MSHAKTIRFAAIVLHRDKNIDSAMINITAGIRQA